MTLVRICSGGLVVHTWKKLLRLKIMSSLLSSSIPNLFIFAMLIHYDVLIDNQAFIYIFFNIFFHIFRKKVEVEKLLRQNIMSSLISSFIQNIFIFGMLIHHVVMHNYYLKILIYAIFMLLPYFGDIST